MSVVRFIPNVNRLAKAMAKAGGKKAGQAIEDAQAGLQEIAPPCVDAIDAALAEIVALTPAGAILTDDARLVLYNRSNEIHAFGGLFGLADMGRAAYSLCDLLDLSEGDPPSARAAIDAHVRSLRLLRLGDALPEADRATLLEELAKLLDHVRQEAA